MVTLPRHPTSREERGQELSDRTEKRAGESALARVALAEKRPTNISSSWSKEHWGTGFIERKGLLERRDRKIGTRNRVKRIKGPR